MRDQMSRCHFCGQMVSSELRHSYCVPNFRCVLLCSGQGVLNFLSLYICGGVYILYGQCIWSNEFRTLYPHVLGVLVLPKSTEGRKFIAGYRSYGLGFACGSRRCAKSNR